MFLTCAFSARVYGEIDTERMIFVSCRGILRGMREIITLLLGLFIPP